MVEGLTSGTVQVLGHDPRRQRHVVRPRVGIVLQESGFPSDHSVTETVRMSARTLAVPCPIGEVLELVDPGRPARVGVREPSGGDRRRLDLALAILGLSLIHI